MESADARPRAYTIELVDFGAAARDREVLAAWQRLLDEHEHPNLVYSSPEWAEHTRARGLRVEIALARESGGAIAGVVPLLRHRVVLGRLGLDAVDVLGSVPLVPPDPHLLHKLIEALLSAYPESDAIYFDSLPGNNPCWTLKNESGLLGYCPSGLCRSHLIALDGSFESYLGGLRPKSRYNVQRAARKLRARGLELQECRSPEQVDAFYVAASEVWRRCQQREHFRELTDHPQTRREGLLDLAERGLLKSYLLRVHGTPCAFVIGYQYRGIYSYVGTGYDLAFAKESPGTVLLYLLLERLFSVDRPRLLSFGKGDQAYKRRFGTSEQTSGTLVLLRPTLMNRARVRADRAFRRAAGLVKRAP